MIMKENLIPLEDAMSEKRQPVRREPAPGQMSPLDQMRFLRELNEVKHGSPPETVDFRIKASGELETRAGTSE